MRDCCCAAAAADAAARPSRPNRRSVTPRSRWSTGTQTCCTAGSTEKRPLGAAGSCHSRLGRDGSRRLVGCRSRCRCEPPGAPGSFAGSARAARSPACGHRLCAAAAENTAARAAAWGPRGPARRAEACRSRCRRRPCGCRRAAAGRGRRRATRRPVAAAAAGRVAVRGRRRVAAFAAASSVRPRCAGLKGGVERGAGKGLREGARIRGSEAGGRFCEGVAPLSETCCTWRCSWSRVAPPVPELPAVAPDAEPGKYIMVEGLFARVYLRRVRPPR